jgi:hypothetical protein
LSKWSYEAILDLTDFARTLERELAAAKAELAEYERTVAHMRGGARLQGSATAAVLERAMRAEAELAALREDAERYRWLRDGEIICDIDFPAAKDKAGNTLWLEELDAAIDAAKGGA